MVKLCKTKLNKSQHCSLIVRRLLVLLELGGIADHHQTLQQLHQKFVLKIIMSFQAECRRFSLGTPPIKLTVTI